MNIAVYAPPRLRSTTIRSGNSGLFTRSSVSTNPVSSTAPLMRKPRVTAFAQPLVPDSVPAWEKP